MAITIESTNQSTLSAGYNPLRWYLSSTNVNEKAFRYIVEVYNADGSGDKLFEKKYAPRPVDGWAEVDISRDVQNFLSAHNPFQNSDAQNALEHYLKFDIRFGEEYIVAWDFDDYIFDSGLTGFNQTPNVTPHPFIVGDQVRVELNTTYNDFRDALNGLFTVTIEPDNYTVVTQLPWIGSGGATPGKMYYADNRKSRFLNLTRQTKLSTANIAIPLKDMNSFTGAQFVLGTPVVGEFLTNMPRIVKQNPNQDNWLAFFNNYISRTLRITFENDLGDIAYRSITATTAQGIIQVASGLGNQGTLTIDSGTLPIVKDNAKIVNVYLTNTSGTPLSEVITYQIDRRCNIEDYEIVFMDRLGTFANFAMQLRAYEKGQVNRLTYNQQFGNVYAGLVTFNTWESGTTTYHVDNTKELTLNTNYLTDAESVYFEQLMTSGYVFLKVGNDYFACQVTESGYDVERSKNGNLIRKTINVRYAVQNPINA
jgi:hypothetical protein